MSSASTSTVVDDGCVHTAVVYRGGSGYLGAVLPFVCAAVAAGEAVAVAVPAHRLEPLRAALGPAADGVRWFDMTQVGRNPGRILPEVLLAVADAHRDRPVRIVTESLWPGRTELEYPACVQHEALVDRALVDRALVDRPVTVLCPVDAALGPEVLADAAATHPVVLDEGVRRRSTAYAPDRMAALANRELPAPADPVVFPFDARRLSAARRTAVEEAERAGLDEERIDDVVLAAGELAANSIRHGGGTGVLRVWVDDGALVLEVHDAGHLTDPLVGRRPATLRQSNGRGLLMVNHFADLVRTHTTPDGTTTRVFFELKPE